MPRFSYTARDQAGQTQRATLEAPARRDAMRVLAARGLQVLDLAEATVGNPRPTEAAAALPRVAANLKFSSRERLPFLQALADLIASGMPAGAAVRLLSQRLKEPRLRAVCARLWERSEERRV